MCFADPGRANEAQALSRGWEFIGESARSGNSGQQTLIWIGHERLEAALPVTRRDARFVQEPLGQTIAPAIAAHDATDAFRMNRFPASVVADVARHR